MRPKFAAKTTNKPEIRSACDILKEMLSNPPTKRQCDMLSVPPEFLISIPVCSSSIDKKAISIVEDACHKNYIVSPLSSKKNVIFISPAKYHEHLELKDKSYLPKFK